MNCKLNRRAIQMVIKGAAVHPAAACLLLVVAATCLGCGGRISSPEELAAFTRAYTPMRIDLSKLAVQPSGPYKLGPGGVISVQVDDIVRPVEDEAPPEAGPPREPPRYRIDGAGTICLPLIGQMKVQDKTISQIEHEISASYHPRFLVNMPNVIVRVQEYDVSQVTVLGAVARPGTYEVRRNELTLVDALMKAGGIAGAGSCKVRIRNADGSAERLVAMPVKGTNAAFTNTPLKSGDVLQVEGAEAQYFTVNGLVVRPGAYPYPSGEEYNLAQAIAFAGGPGEFAPDLVHVYRKDADGKVLKAKVRLTGNDAHSAINVPVRPGDLIAVEHTSGSSIKNFLARITGIGVTFGGQVPIVQ